MSRSDADPHVPFLSAEEARIRVGTALALIELAAQVLEELPPPEAALRLGDRELYRYLHAGEAASHALVGRRADETLERPAAGSALGEGLRIYEWSEGETGREFARALRGWKAGR
ncbi:MAG: hypothetical protein ACLF0P_17415 [Thermoanaerobaculia bacterium]